MENKNKLTYSGIFFDSANLKEFKKWFKTGILGGVTTNPVILAKEKVLNIPAHINKMIEICGEGFPISIEIPDSDMSKTEMLNLAKKYSEMYPKNAVIKVPMDPRNPQKSFEVILTLARLGIRVNATIGLSMGQLVGAAESLRFSKSKGDNYISLFWGRRDEAKNQIVQKIIEENTIKLGRELSEQERRNLLDEWTDRVPNAEKTLTMTLSYLKKHYLNAKVIIGSVRSIYQIEQAFNLGADIVTIPPNLLEDWMFSQRAVETVDQFNQAYRDVKNKIKII